jgi:hypothetical protein
VTKWPKWPATTDSKSFISHFKIRKLLNWAWCEVWNALTSVHFLICLEKYNRITFTKNHRRSIVSLNRPSCFVLASVLRTFESNCDVNIWLVQDKLAKDMIITIISHCNLSLRDTAAIYRYRCRSSYMRDHTDVPGCMQYTVCKAVWYEWRSEPKYV